MEIPLWPLSQANEISTVFSRLILTPTGQHRSHSSSKKPLFAAEDTDDFLSLWAYGCCHAWERGAVMILVSI